jgi:hypothetical protein
VSNWVRNPVTSIGGASGNLLHTNFVSLLKPDKTTPSFWCSMGSLNFSQNSITRTTNGLYTIGGYGLLFSIGKPGNRLHNRNGENLQGKQASINVSSS